jgi:hypothetical protein
VPPPANALHNSNKLKLGLFSLNADGGIAITKVPERWRADWADIAEVAKMVDRAGFEFILHRQHPFDEERQLVLEVDKGQRHAVDPGGVQPQQFVDDLFGTADQGMRTEPAGIALALVEYLVGVELAVPARHVHVVVDRFGVGIINCIVLVVVFRAQET